jgi:hypothetical protein
MRDEVGTGGWSIMRRGAGFVCVFVVLLVSAAPAIAQQDLEGGAPGIDAERGKPNTYEAIPVGPFLFTPAIQLNYQYRDNIFFTPDDPISDSVWMARARLQFELPINESYILFAYTPQYRDYVDYELDDKWSHFVDVLGGFEFSNGLIIEATYKYMEGNLENREVDPGGELYWGDRWYKKNFAGVQLSYWATAKNGFNIEADYTDLKHEDPDLWYDYERYMIGAGWLHQLSEILVMNLAYRRTEFKPSENLFFDNEFRESTSDEITVGFRGMINPVLKTEIVVGYRSTEYNTPGEGEGIIPDFSGFIVKGYINWSMGHGSSLKLDLLRSDYPSNFGINANYVATGAALQYQYEKNRFRAQARGRYQVNDYAVPDLVTGLDREDPIKTVGLGLGYRFGPYVSLWGGYLYENRDSTIYRYSYDYSVYTLSLVVGY